MTVVVREQHGSCSKTYCKKFKRKGIRYYLFLFSLRLYNVECEIYTD